MLPGETVQVLTAGTKTDPYSELPIGEDWGNPTSVDVPDVLCEPRPSDEPVEDARNSVTSGWTLYFQTIPDTLPTSENQVKVRGINYWVEGEPADWRMGDWRPGLVVQAWRRVG